MYLPTKQRISGIVQRCLSKNRAAKKTILTTQKGGREKCVLSLCPRSCPFVPMHYNLSLELMKFTSPYKECPAASESTRILQLPEKIRSYTIRDPLCYI